MGSVMMAKHKFRSFRSLTTRLIFVTVFVQVAMADPWTGTNNPRAQTIRMVADVQVAQDVGPSGCVALCGDGSSDTSYGGGGAGCAMGGGYANVQSTGTTAYGESNNLNSAGLAAKRRGDLKDAVSLYQQALVINSNNMTAYRNIGSALTSLGFEYYDSGNNDEAIKTLDEAVNYVPFEEDVQEMLSLLKENSVLSLVSSGLPRTCGICGKALVGDVNYGYDTSSSFWTYVQQSQGKFQNCQSKFYDAACEDTQGQIFYRNLDSCDQSQPIESSFKLCVDKLLNGYYHQN